MISADIALNRLFNQQIERTKFTAPGELVHWLGALQAQDYAMAKWAIGLRVPDGNDQFVEDAINQGHIIRTHILRPTWHFVAAPDFRWMLQLTAPHLKRIAASMNRKLELEDLLFPKIYHFLTKSLAGGQQLTRQELMTALNQAGIPTNGFRASQIMFQAEIDGIVCNGARRNKQFTYALLDEIVPPSTQIFSRNEALAELTNRYFTSHGPATIQDFAWWSGLSLTDARLGLAHNKANLISDIVDGQTYWFAEKAVIEKPNQESLYLLPAFDEFMVSYKDRTASLLPAYSKATITGNGIFKPIVVVNGKVAGLWQPVQQKNKIKVLLSFFDSSAKLNEELLVTAGKKYGIFRNAFVEIS